MPVKQWAVRKETAKRLVQARWLPWLNRLTHTCDTTGICMHATHLQGSGHGSLHLSGMAAMHRVEEDLEALGSFIPFSGNALQGWLNVVQEVWSGQRRSSYSCMQHPRKPPSSAPTDYAEPALATSCLRARTATLFGCVFDIGWYQSPNIPINCTCTGRDGPGKCSIQAAFSDIQ